MNVTKVDFRTISASLASLSPEELSRICDQCNVLLGLRGKVPKTNGNGHDDAEMVLQIISSTLSDLGVEFGSHENARRSTAYTRLKQMTPALMTYLHQVGQSKTEVNAILGLGVKLLYYDLGRMKIPVSSRTVMQHIHRIPAVINRSFPGYAQEGVLGWLIGKQNEGRNQWPYVND